MDFSNLIIGIVFFISGLAIIYYKIETYDINKPVNNGFQYYSIIGAILSLMLAFFLIRDEIWKIL